MVHLYPLDFKDLFHIFVCKTLNVPHSCPGPVDYGLNRPMLHI